MTELADRLTRLADAAVADRHLADPSALVAVDGRRPRPRWPWLGAAAVILVVVALVAVVVVGDDGDTGPVTAGPSSVGTSEASESTGPGSTDATTEPPATGPLGDPVLSIAFRLVHGVPPLGLRLTLRDATGAVVGEAASAEVEEVQPDGSDRIRIRHGIVLTLPEEGSYAVELTGGPAPVTCAVGTVLAGDRVILPITLEESGAPWCNRPEDVEDWIAPSGAEGEQYLGLTEGEAVDRIVAAGGTTQLFGRDGVGLAGIREDQPGRVDLMTFAGVVVSAQVGGEPLVVDGPEPREPLAVVVTAVDGLLTGGGEATVRVGDDTATLPWPAGVDETGPTRGVLFTDLHPGRAVLELSGDATCEETFDLPRGGAVVTVWVEPDGSLPAGGGCGAMVETLDEHLAAVTDGFDRHQSLPAYEGLSEEQARGRARDEGLTVRVLARDGLPFGRDDDLRTDRVNLVLYDDEVRAAAIF